MSPRPPLRPRRITYEPTPQQQEEAFARARRRALHFELHDLFSQSTVATEDTFGGRMNLPPEKSESVTGCELTRQFVGWLETHEIPDGTDHARRRALFAALHRLDGCRPDLCMIVVEHSRTHCSWGQLAQRWGTDRNAVSKEYNEGLSLLMSYLPGAK